MYKSVIRPFLFLFDPETIHHAIFRQLKIAFKIPVLNFFLRKYFRYENKKLERNLFGLSFKNPVGLAAGFDKDAKLVDELADLGFGFIEIGTLTPKAQSGNEKPRLFRLPEDSAIINRMGFNNEGVASAVERLKRRNSRVIVGGNIGKNKITPNENATEDYDKCFEALFDVVDYFVVNVSSPNTPDLRALQDKEPLTNLLRHIQQKNSEKETPKPILLKIAPDLNKDQLDDIVEIVRTTGIAGIIATNTTISRENLQSSEYKIKEIGPGGLSGAPLKNQSTEIIKYLHKRSEGKFPIIAVGGIFSGEDALEKLNAGASLVQIYTGFIYNGPSIIKEINKKILKSSI
ncbi:quinone-dependent dihydroorotate dehydrogenase [Fulvivirgaceae bacterium BMA10]|uniref:Dihydroorotate dehydrogenase (quinone) n=1 Tax=Splendidivirga corallicola TaxID=3051826 RepID=A0ABT8KKN2_9BACT|nr:quinone-dependent dihydroorotate dehydrogenase [Fulvivirgaceae bacterium BMA10]